MNKIIIQENFEFLQFFKEFSDENYNDKKYKWHIHFQTRAPKAQRLQKYRVCVIARQPRNSKQLQRNNSAQTEQDSHT